MLDGFEQITLGNKHGPSVSITKNGITFSKATIDAFPKPKKEYVLLHVNKEKQLFAITQATKEEIGALPFMSTNPKASSVRWNSKEILRIFAGMTGWKLKECSGYRVAGKYLRDDKAIVFNLNDAVPIT